MWPFKVRTWARVLLRAFALWLMLACGFVPTNAIAHAVLSSTSPYNNEVLVSLPDAVELNFNEPVRAISVTANFPDGSRQELETRAAGRRVTARLDDRAVRGTMIVSYRVVSEDEHPVGGSLVFHIGVPSRGAASEPQGNVAIPLSLAVWLVHTASILYLAVAVGGSFFVRWSAAKTSSGSSGISLVLPGAALIVARLYLAGLDELGLGLRFSASRPILAAMQGSAGISAALMLLALILVGFRSSWKPAVQRLVAAAALLVASAALALGGHTNLAHPFWLAKLAIFLHSVTLLFWIGSLPPLWRISRDHTDKRQLAKFSRAIPLPFVAMILAGVALVVIEVPVLSEILWSLWGRILTLKIALVILVCMIAVYNRAWLTRPVLAGDVAATRKLRRSIAFEILLAVAIVGSASLWHFSGPGQQQFAPAPTIVSLHLHSDQAMAQIEVGTESNGTKKMNVVIIGPDFGPLEPKEVVLRLSNPELGIERLKFELAGVSGIGFVANQLPINDLGGWVVDLEVLVDDFNSVHLEGNLK